MIADPRTSMSCLSRRSTDPPSPGSGRSGAWDSGSSAALALRDDLREPMDCRTWFGKRVHRTD